MQNQPKPLAEKLFDPLSLNLKNWRDVAWNMMKVLSAFQSTQLKSRKKCLDPNLKNEITRSILKINKRFIAHFNRCKEWILDFQEKFGKLQNIDLL